MIIASAIDAAMSAEERSVKLMNSNPTQCQRVLDYMCEHGSVTQCEALKDLGVMRLASRISELRRNGHKIESQMVKVENRYGETCRVKRYFLKGDANG